MTSLPFFDLLLVVLLLWLAWRLLATADLFQAAVLFIAFGLLMALAWVRLRAPDLALAEAAIGAGITGALVLTTLGRLGAREKAEAEPAGGPGGRLLSAAAWGLFLLLAWAFISLPAGGAGLAPWVDARLAESGVSSPVTAVLLNFRGYDTLLEIGVLFLALLGVWGLGEGEPPPSESPAEALLALTRLLLPLTVVVSGYLLWLGSHLPGGAFQAGAVLAAGGILLLLSGWRPVAALTGWRLRLLLGGGFALFLTVAAAVTVAGGRFLEYPAGKAYPLILLIETALTVSIAATLVVLFAGGRPPQERQPGRGR